MRKYKDLERSFGSTKTRCALESELKLLASNPAADEY